jgi:NTE family protein
MAPRRKRVFILGGGAALGAHHVGAMRYLEERDVRPDAIVASSIGIVNACAYVSGGLPLLEQAWHGFWSFAHIVSPSLKHNPLVGTSLFSMDRLSAAIERFIDFPKVLTSPLEIEVVTLNLSRGTGEVHSTRSCADWQEVRTLSRAGYAIPLLFPPVRFRGEWYSDGGFAWNIPLERAIALGATEIYLLAPIASQLPYKKRFGSFLDFVQRFLDVMWRTIGNMGYLNALMDDGRFHGVPVTVIEPTEQWSGFGPLAVFNAYPTKNKSLMQAGYRDAKRALRDRDAAAAAQRVRGRGDRTSGERRAASGDAIVRPIRPERR